MASEKYVIATAEISFQVFLRNILDPCGYMFLDGCTDAVSLIRLIRAYHPDFFMCDNTMNMAQTRLVLDTANDERLCPGIIFSEHINPEIRSILDNCEILSYVRKPVDPETLSITVAALLHDFYNLKESDKELNEAVMIRETETAISKAKEILMKKDKLTEAAAYQKIRVRSMQLRIPMKEVAESIISLNEMKTSGHSMI